MSIINASKGGRYSTTFSPDLTLDSNPFPSLILGKPFRISPGEIVRVNIPGNPPFEIIKSNRVPRTKDPHVFSSVIAVHTSTTAYLSRTDELALKKDPEYSFTNLSLDENSTIYIAADGQFPIYINNISNTRSSNRLSLGIHSPRSYFLIDQEYAQRDPSLEIERYLLDNRDSILNHQNMSYLRDLKRRAQGRK
ncbi:hypothetical protein KW787_02225 [Candidatus Pacearchaeota archaeon]|nr:hypothetical protein [Candidatus Pacearchaeota archaeon]